MLHNNAALQVQRIIVGQLAVTTQPQYLTTVVGSCIATCLYDPVTRIGGMNHFMLPESPHGSIVIDMAYGVHAIDGLIAQLVRHGARPRRLLAKVFGAANSLFVDHADFSAGEANHTFIVDTLARLSVPVVAQSLGGTQGRHIRFAAHSGEVRVKPLGMARSRRLLSPTRNQ